MKIIYKDRLSKLKVMYCHDLNNLLCKQCPPPCSSHPSYVNIKVSFCFGSNFRFLISTGATGNLGILSPKLIFS